MKTQMIIKLNVFLIILLILSALISSSAVNISYAADGSNAFDKTDVMDDLQSSTVNGKPFKLSDYPYNENGSVQLLNFVEYCYAVRANDRNNFGLYLYIYNPIASNIATGAGSNKVQLAVAYDESGNPTDYEKFDLKFCSKSTGDHANLFYKFRIIDHVSEHDGKTIAQRVNSTERRYDISGIELFEYGQTNADEYGVGGTYRFTGYAAGYGLNPNSENTLSCKATDLETLRLKLKHTNFRPEVVSHLGRGHQNDLNSVYFSVPNSVIEKYGNLQAIKAEWFEYRTAPIVVTRELKTFQYIMDNAIGKTLKNNPGNTHSLDRDISIAFTPEFVSDDFHWSYNNRSDANTSKLLTYIFLRGYSNLPYRVSSNDLLKWISVYDASFNGGKILNKYSADLFERELSSDRTLVPYVGNDIHHKLVDIDAGDEYNLLSYDVNHVKWWDKFLDFGLFPPETGINFENISAIKQVEDADLQKSDLSLALLINPDDVDDFKAYCVEEKQKGNTTFLFRFALTDYFSTDLFTFTGDTFHDSLYPDGKDTAYVAQQNVFLDFDIIQLTFSKNGNYHVIPVVCDPIDTVNGITPPIKGENPIETFFDKLLKNIKDFFDINWKTILGVCVGIAALIIAIIIISSIIKNRKNQISIEISSPPSEGNKSKKTKRKVKK